MLAQLTQLLESQEAAMSLAEISRALRVQPSAVLDMIELLARKGRLVEIGPDGLCCTSCGQKTDCNLLATLGKRYAAVSTLTIIPEARSR